MVIGILIALQINNWNTKKQERNELQGYLNNIIKNIEFDMDNMRETIIYQDSIKLFTLQSQEFTIPDSITVEGFLASFSVNMNPFIEFYFQSDKSGFEALKSSGYLNKLKGTSLESKLYAYYYQVKKIEEQEKSQNEFIERMEVKGWSDNMFQELIDILAQVTKSNNISESQKERLAQVYKHPTMTSVYFRIGQGETILGQYYRNLLMQGKEIIQEIEKEIK